LHSSSDEQPEKLELTTQEDTMPSLLKIAISASALSLMAMAPAQAAEHVVKMLNKSGNKQMQFEPAFTMAAPGDTIKFVSVDKGHSVESIAEMWPEGAAPVKGAISKDVTMTVDKEGVYGVKCTPHYLMGMVALIEVGKPTNLDKAKAFKAPTAAAKRFEELFAEVK
jgi:pseudoazurin